MPQNPAVVATMGDSGVVQVWDLSPQLATLMRTVGEPEAGSCANADATKATSQRVAPRHALTGHAAEGYAVDWSPATPGRLITGDNDGAVHL